MKIEIQSQQEFTYDGRVGAFMFICGPVLSGFGYAWLLNELSTSYPRPGLPLVVVGLGALGWVVGCVKMLVGRSYRHNVIVER
ncbi:hypothetical protein ABID26_006485 [Mesorhizobium shonense]|uniref:Uncharacterized protein n=1 Tax=Mesorhizobium shonense TaxID=1209948 RepID=A0ABV2I2S2_9HYPH